MALKANTNLLVKNNVLNKIALFFSVLTSRYKELNFDFILSSPSLCLFLRTKIKENTGKNTNIIPKANAR
jgi:hypothetical protein